MSESLHDLGLELVCETCESEIDVDEDLGVCRQCGMAFLLDGAVASTSPATGTYHR